LFGAADAVDVVLGAGATADSLGARAAASAPLGFAPHDPSVPPGFAPQLPSPFDPQLASLFSPAPSCFAPQLPSPFAPQPALGASVCVAGTSFALVACELAQPTRTEPELKTASVAAMLLMFNMRSSPT
jgi:hypothetical protein